MHFQPDIDPAIDDGLVHDRRRVWNLTRNSREQPLVHRTEPQWRIAVRGAVFLAGIGAWPSLTPLSAHDERDLKNQGRARLPVFEVQNVFQNAEHLWSLSKVDSTTGVGGSSD